MPGDKRGPTGPATVAETFTLGETFERAARRWDDRTVIRSDRGSDYTYGELNEAVDATARGLLAAGVSEGDRVAFVLRNVPEFVVTHFAVQKVGAVTVTLNYRLAAGDVEYILDAARADALVYETAFADTIEDVSGDAVPSPAVSIGDGGFQAFQEPGTATVTPRGRSSDVAYVAHTSGSTGRPKLVPHTHEDVLQVRDQWVQEMAIRRDDRAFVLVPLAHVIGFDYLHAHVLTGAAVVLQADFDPVDALALIDGEDVTGFFAVPAQINAMLGAYRGERDLSSLRYFRTGGDSIARESVERGREVFAENFYNLYGLTEIQANPVVYTPEDPDEKATSVGPLWPNGWDLRVVEPAEPDELDTDAVVDRPGTGVLLVRGTQVMDGYLDRPDATERAFVDGWFYTEDIVEIDEDGFVTIVDRIDNMIVSGGENVYPQEVELTLLEHDGVVDCGVLGLDDETWGQRVAALVVPEGDPAPEELDRYLEESRDLADFKRPRQYEFVEEIPRNASGSIVRSELADLADAFE